MGATFNFSLRFARVSLQRISTAMSLISLALGFGVFAILILINWHQAELNGLSGGRSFAVVGGIIAILVGVVFFVAACLHCMFCADIRPRRRSGVSRPVSLSLDSTQSS